MGFHLPGISMLEMYNMKNYKKSIILLVALNVIHRTILPDGWIVRQYESIKTGRKTPLYWYHCKDNIVSEAITEEKQLICGYCPYGGDPALMTLRTPEVYFFTKHKDYKVMWSQWGRRRRSSTIHFGK